MQLVTKNKPVFFIIIIGLLVYFNSLFNGFVWDDEEQILNNLPVHSITNFSQFFKESTFNSGGAGKLGGLYYKPLMTVVFSLIYTIFGPNAFFFHLAQLTLHIGSTIILFLIFKHFLKNQKILPLILALIFLIHPINTEAVVYISDLQDILFFFFGIFALYRIIQKPLNFKNCLLVSLLLLFSLLSKETGAAFVIIAGVYILLFKRKVLGRYVLIGTTAVGIYSFLRFYTAGIYFNKHGLSPITIMPFSQRILSIPRIIFSYLRSFIFPDNLAINQHWAVKTITWNDFILPSVTVTIFFLLLLTTAVILWQKKSDYFKYYLFCLIWFVVGLGLHLQIFPLDLTYSDRWFYFPIAGLLGMLGVIFLQVPQKFSRIFIYVAIVILLSLSIRTFIRNFDWKNGLILYGHDIKIAKDSFDLENNFGVELFRNNQMDQAAIHFEKSTILAPNWWTNWNNLGVIAERQGNYDQALQYYKKAIDNGNYYLAFENYAGILLFHKDVKEAKKFLDSSLKILPLNAKLWFYLSLTEYKLGNQSDALNAAKNAYQLSPDPQTDYVYNQLLQNKPLQF